jgi:2-dehydropantoate 2-reductase
VLRQSGFDVTIADYIRAEIWTKLIGNAGFNPLSAIARARIDEIMNDPGLGRIALASMREVGAGRGSGWCPLGDGH